MMLTTTVRGFLAAIGVVVSFTFTLAFVNLSSSSRHYYRTSFADSSFQSQRAGSGNRRIKNLSETSATTVPFFAVLEDKPDSARVRKKEAQARLLGSQELLMLPRQYTPPSKINPPVFPPMIHVTAAILSSTPSTPTLLAALEEVMRVHPLLRAHVQGNGEPEKRIDLLQMVRSQSGAEDDACRFLCPSTIDDCGFTVARDVLSIVQAKELERSWQEAFARNLDGDTNCVNVSTGPLWKVQLHRTTSDDGYAEGKMCALLFVFNHAISDQSSVNMMLDHLLSTIASIEEDTVNMVEEQTIPVALEDSVLGTNNRWTDVQEKGLSLDTLKYVGSKAAEVFKNPVVLPDSESSNDPGGGGGVLAAITTVMGKAAGGEDADSMDRKSTLQFRKLSKKGTEELLKKCRENGVSVSNALSAAVTFTSSDFIHNGRVKKEKRNYKVLQSLDMRRFGAKLDKCETVACMAGSHDLMLGPLSDNSGEALRHASAASRQKNLEQFWRLAKTSKGQFESFVESGGPEQATRVFDFAMTISDLNNLIYQTAQSKVTQGRAYSAGIVNAGVFERQAAVPKRKTDLERNSLKVQHGKYKIEDLYFATSHARTGCLYQASCLTLNGEMHCTFHPVMPIVSEETNARFADAFMELLEVVAGVHVTNPSKVGNTALSILDRIPENALPLSVAAIGLGGISMHAGAYSAFFRSILEMKEALPANSHDFWAALNFWIFFAVGHPILQPIFWISDVLHGTPGPKIADLVPVLFLLGNLGVIATIAISKEVRSAVNIAALAAFFTYVGAGLDGQAGLGDYNLAVDDSFKGQTVKGCPAYSEVRQPSMDNFDVRKYQGKWYEQKFHDWTQFKEVYDTTLDIKLTENGNGWIDDFAVKGPAPDAAPLSWDKSPVANGAHYFLFGRIDEKDPPGVLRESGFGVEFPNYIIDVQKDIKTGDYTEAIQFQCLERGGVRIFEGINFLSRSPSMSEAGLTAMHARAEKAGIYPYGASPEQMHSVARRPVGASDVDNSWQAMWRAIGVDRLLELLTESIEDGGR